MMKKLKTFLTVALICLIAVSCLFGCNVSDTQPGGKPDNGGSATSPVPDGGDDGTSNPDADKPNPDEGDNSTDPNPDDGKDPANPNPPDEGNEPTNPEDPVNPNPPDEGNEPTIPEDPANPNPKPDPNPDEGGGETPDIPDEPEIIDEIVGIYKVSINISKPALKTNYYVEFSSDNKLIIYSSDIADFNRDSLILENELVWQIESLENIKTRYVICPKDDISEYFLLDVLEDISEDYSTIQWDKVGNSLFLLENDKPVFYAIQISFTKI